MACPKISIMKSKRLDDLVEGWHFFSKVKALEIALDRAEQLAKEEAERWLAQKETQHPCPTPECNQMRVWFTVDKHHVEPVKRRWRFIFLGVWFVPVLIIIYVYVAKVTATWEAYYACSPPDQLYDNWEEEE